MRAAIVAHESLEDVVEHEGRRKEHEPPQIGRGVRHGLGIGAQPGGNSIGSESAEEHKGHGQCEAQKDGVCPDPVFFLCLVSGSCQGVLRGAAHAKHHADAAQKAVDGNGQVQGSQPRGPQAGGYEVGVGKYITGYAQDPDDAQGGIADEFVSQGRIVNACRVCHESLLSVGCSPHRPKKGRLRFPPSMACGGNPGVLVLHPATQGICRAVISIIAGSGLVASRQGRWIVWYGQDELWYPGLYTVFRPNSHPGSPSPCFLPLPAIIGICGFQGWSVTL